jgi:hypothetical protein
MLLSTFTCALSLATLTHAPEPIKVMVVGTFHMAGGRDMVNPNVKDILEPRRQREVLELVDRLAVFKPTKIGVESVFGTDTVQKRLDALRAGKYEFSRSEIDQVALRVAMKSGLNEIYGIDWKKDMDIQGTLDHAETTGQPHIKQKAFEFVQGKLMPMVAKMESMTLTQIFHDGNLPSLDRDSHSMYQVLAEVGRGGDYRGADLIAGWYERNLKIAVNIRRIAKPGDRIFILIGAGHCKLLRDFLSETPGFEVESPVPYLK